MTWFGQLNSEKSREERSRWRPCLSEEPSQQLVDVIKNKALLWSTSEKFSTRPCLKEMRREFYKRLLVPARRTTSKTDSRREVRRREHKPHTGDVKAVRRRLRARSGGTTQADVHTDGWRHNILRRRLIRPPCAITVRDRNVETTNIARKDWRHRGEKKKMV